jgi:hypothetical protein
VVAADLTELANHGRAVQSVFDLLGWRENDLTAALGFTLAKSPKLLASVIGLAGLPTDPVSLRLETRGHDGRTDLELEAPTWLAVVEAKRGWNLPTTAQLRRYAKRVTNHGSGALITLSDCSQAWATGGRGLPRAVDGVPVKHVPWSAIQDALRKDIGGARGVERHWLDEFASYIRRAVRVVDAADMWTYCVVVSNERLGERTFRQYVLDEGVYFHPFGWGHGWPKQPPNFLAFRWDNTVQRVHRVVAHEVVESLRVRWADIEEGSDGDRPHVIHTLSAPLRFDPLPTGRSYRASRMWVLLDQLFTAASLEEALLGTDTLRRA